MCRKAINEYKALVNFESLPVLRIEETTAPSEVGSTLTPFLSPSDSTSTLLSTTVLGEGWKSSATAILDTLHQYKLLLKPPKECDRLPLKSHMPNSLDSIRQKLLAGQIISLEELKIAAGFIIFAASLYLSAEETRERDRLMALFEKLI